MATVICGVLSSPFDEIRLCSAGHPPPVLVRPGEAATLMEGDIAPPLGVVAELEPKSSRWSLTDGSVLVLYTDGLVERRGESITEGMERLRIAVHGEPPERLCGQIMDAMIGSYVPADDVALLALRVTPRPPVRTSTVEDQDEWSLVRSDLFPCDRDSVRSARRFVVESVELLGLQRLPDVQLMVSELATNAVLHAKSRFDVVLERLDRNRVRVEVRDFGNGVPAVLPGSSGSLGGRGLKIVDLLAQTWGVENRPAGQGKSTWFVVATGAPSSWVLPR
jgi:anti-sigma regulatory factor (Ser/Thr protein kinase)